jgi:hypothetical protein
MVTRASSVAVALTAATVLFGTLSCSSNDEQGSSPTTEGSELDLGPAPAGGAGDAKAIGADENNAWVRKMVDCLKRDGFNAETTEGTQGILGFQQVGGATEQVEAWSKGLTSCQGEVGDPPEIPHWTDAQLSNLYDFFVKQKECLESNGHSITDPPSRETWIDTYYSGDPWGPYADIDRLSPTALAELEAACPQLPTAEDVN